MRDLREKFKHCGLAVIVFALIATADPRSAEADFVEGWQAYEAGDLVTAIAAWSAAAEEGDPKAQYNLGVLHDRGIGLPRDLEKALAWWRRAAAQGHVWSQHNIALSLIERGGSDDLSEAVDWLQQATDSGFSRSQYSLGKLYERGLGVAADDLRAHALVAQAAQSGLVLAQYSLGKMYRDGRGTEADPILAAQWFFRAAAQGYAKAQSRLATRYRRGEGVERDLVEALKWASLAQAQGDELAAELSAELHGLLSAEEIAEAERRAAGFQPRDP